MNIKKTTHLSALLLMAIILTGCKSDAAQCVDAGVKAYELSGKRTPEQVAEETADRWLVCLSVANGKE